MSTTGHPPPPPGPRPQPMPPPPQPQPSDNDVNQHHYEDDYPEVTEDQIEDFKRRGGLAL